jgi:hypothetical protein
MLRLKWHKGVQVHYTKIAWDDATNVCSVTSGYKEVRYQMAIVENSEPSVVSSFAYQICNYVHKSVATKNTYPLNSNQYTVI